MSIPKFRLYDKHSKKMIYFDFSNVFGGKLEGNVNINDVMQYIGLKDNNSKEIYCGDIVLLRGRYTTGDDFKDTGYVKFDSIYAFEYRIVSTIDNYSFGRFSSEYLEVIGNIYENPELLEDGK